MSKVKILGIVGSPRKKGNTAKLVQRALDGAKEVPGIETELYELAGKKINHCVGCLKCFEIGACCQKDGFGDFLSTYMTADGIIWGAPVYHMGVPSLIKAAIDRLGCSGWASFVVQGKDIPRFSKVCGVLTIGGHRFGGEDQVMSFLVHSALTMNGVAVSGDTMMGDYIGAGAYTGGAGMEYLKSKDCVLKDREGMMCAENLGKRVAEMTRIVKAGISALENELPSEYFSKWEEA